MSSDSGVFLKFGMLTESVVLSSLLLFVFSLVRSCPVWSSLVTCNLRCVLSGPRPSATDATKVGCVCVAFHNSNIEIATFVNGLQHKIRASSVGWSLAKGST